MYTVTTLCASRVGIIFQYYLTLWLHCAIFVCEGNKQTRSNDNAKRHDGKVQRRKTNAVNSVDGTTNINRALWHLAEEMKKIKES